MDDDECPDSTVMIDEDEIMDDEEVDIPFSHRRSFDEPQSNRISSTAMQLPSFQTAQALPPLPKLIFRPPTQAGNYHSVSFASQQSGSRVASSSRGAMVPAPRLSAFNSGRIDGGTQARAAPQPREIALPRLEPMQRSELTISRVSSNPRVGAGHPGTSGGNEFARVGGVSISRVVDNPPVVAKIPNPGLTKKIAVPALKKIGGGASSQVDTGRKFGRRFLKSAPGTSGKPQLQGAAKMPMSVMRASSSEERPGGSQQLPDTLDSDAVDFVSHRRLFPTANSSTGGQPTPRKTLVTSETLMAQQGTGIKLHISKKPIEVWQNDESSSDQSSVASIAEGNVCNTFPFLPPGVSVTKTGPVPEEVIAPQKAPVRGPKIKPLKIPQELEIEDVEDSEETLQDESEESSASCPQFMVIDEDGNQQIAEFDDSSRRSKRKRQPIKSPQTPVKVRKRRGAKSQAPEVAETVSPVVTPTPAMSTPTSEPGSETVTPAKGKGSGRGRGRPKGSTNKARLEKKAAEEKERRALNESQGGDEGGDNDTPGEKEADTSKEDTSIDSPTKADLPLDGDPTVNAEISSSSPPVKRPRGRGRGSGTPRGTPKTRGTRGTKSPRGDRKSPEGKKLKEKKEAIKAPPPVQNFEEETRMSMDIKPPIPDRLTALSTPVVVDEESRASNVSSTSTSTTAKAKRYTKDPVEERKPVTAETLFEYQWPTNDKNAEFYFLQEQISEYLGVKSFKRKYPDIRRRIVDMEERDFLRDSKVVSETQCDLGLTALHSCDVLDIMFADFPDKYEEYRKIFVERKEAEMSKLKPQNGTETPAVRDRSAEFMRRIVKSCAKWNCDNNKDRLEERPCSFDLQTGTLHYQKDKMKVLPPECTKIGSFPVAVLPGQFTDGFKMYTPDELFYLPLNSVRYGPISENWIVDSESSEESSDSEESSSSNDSSSSSSDDEDGSIADNDQNYITLSDEAGNVLYRGIQGLTKVSVDAKCKSCEGTSMKNKDGQSEVLLHCSRCDVANHPTCLELTVDMLPFITKYYWECTDCKNCIECNDPADEDKMLFCDCCDRGYHIYCVGLRKVPNGRWHCSVCAVCYSCGVTQPSPDDRMAEWHHEFRKGEKGTKYYLHSSCVACHKLFKRGQFCPSCLKVHTKYDNKDLLECRKCEKWVHRGCVKRPEKSMFGFMCDPCDANFRSKSKLPSHVN